MEMPKELPKGLYQLVTWPDERLNQPSEECTEADLPDLQKMIKPMIKIMEEYNGVGLAAVQIGVHKRFCVMYVGQIDPYNPNSRQIVEMINPQVVETSEEKEKMLEGCLSLPCFREGVDRHVEVTVKYRNMEWKEVTAVFTGIEAECVQHEIEHMNGVTQNVKLSVMKQQMYEKKLAKARKHGKVRH